MKFKFFSSIAAVFLISINVFGQNINGKLGTNGEFIIRDTSSTFLTVSQSTGNLTLNQSLRFATMTAGSQTGVIFKGNNRFIHNYFGSSTLGENTFVGINSGNFTLGGNQGQASYNTGVGQSTLNSLTTGYYNSAFGTYSLFSNTTGYNNSGFGEHSLYLNTSGFSNCAFGSNSLKNNSTGNSNSAFGSLALVLNTTGFQNSSFGENSLCVNTTGNYNTALGRNTLSSVTIGNNNTGVGNQAGSYITTGSNNTAIGNSAQVPSNTANNQVRIGNTSITYAGVQVAWTITSDINWKQNIKASGLGLGFITKLRPVSYARINDENQKTEYGFIAQDIEKVLKESGIENAGMITVDDAGRYELRYNDLLAPMVKAIQELKEENEIIKSENEELKARLTKIEQMQNILLKELNQLKTVTN